VDLSRDDYIALHAKIEALQSTLVFVLAAIGQQDGRAIAKLHQAVGEHWSKTLERAGLPSVDGAAIRAHFAASIDATLDEVFSQASARLRK